MRGRGGHRGTTESEDEGGRICRKSEDVGAFEVLFLSPFTERSL